MATAKKTTKSKSTAKKSASKKKEPQQRPAEFESYTGRYITGVIFLFLAVCTFISYFVTEGSFIVFFSNLMKGLLGWGYWASGVCFFALFMVLCFSGRKPVALRAVCLFLLPIFFSAFIGLLSFEMPTGTLDLKLETNILFEDGKDLSSAGVMGGLIDLLLVKTLSKFGCGAILILCIFFCVFKALGTSFDLLSQSVAESTAERAAKPRKKKQTAAGPSYSAATVPARAKTVYIPQLDDDDGVTVRKKTASSPKFVADIPMYEDDDDFMRKTGREPAYTTETPRRKKSSAKAAEAAEDVPEEVSRSTSTRKKRASGTKQSASPTDNVKPLSAKEAAAIAGIELEEPAEKPEAEIVGRHEAPAAKKSAKSEKVTREDTEKAVKAIEKEIAASEEKGEEEYSFPPTELLNEAKSAGADSEKYLRATQELLENALRSFGISSSVFRITNGPTVTRYDIKLEQGVKLSKVTNLSGDLALSLGVENVRIAPIPDEISTVGIEVPNKIVNTVSLREIIESDEFRNAKSRLSFSVGKDIGGHAIVGNISKLPHMLVAGTTGSGKSVCMNSLILSILYKARPDEVKFIMIDPKMVELGIYNSIPHLYVPVVTEPKKASGALQWAVVEMLKRYRLFSEAGVRDLDTYNKVCRSTGDEPLPAVVIVIDELADLMMAASKEVEESICRIAQMGRAAGMHLIIATQRPSADVITGLMKANIPSRIAFAVSSSLESRIIMDQSGAEKLIGHGDMLYAPIGCSKPLRVQGAFVSDEERENIIKYISDNSTVSSERNDEIFQFMDKANEAKNAADSKEDKSADKGAAGDYDEVLPQAVEVVLEMKSCSVSMLQRRLKLGYSRAARVVDQMEELGVVGPYEGAKPRSVPITREEWQEIALERGIISEEDFALASEMSDEGVEEEIP